MPARPIQDDLATLAREADSGAGSMALAGRAARCRGRRGQPAHGRVRELLVRSARLPHTYAPPSPSPAEPAPQARDPGTSEEAQRPPGFTPKASGGQVPTRDDMLRELARIADFFRRTEPHSPLAYTLAGGDSARAHDLAGAAAGGHAGCFRAQRDLIMLGIKPGGPRRNETVTRLRRKIACTKA